MNDVQDKRGYPLRIMIPSSQRHAVFHHQDYQDSHGVLENALFIKVVFLVQYYYVGVGREVFSVRPGKLANMTCACSASQLVEP